MKLISVQMCQLFEYKSWLLVGVVHSKWIKKQKDKNKKQKNKKEKKKQPNTVKIKKKFK